MKQALITILIVAPLAFTQDFQGADVTNTQAVLRFTGVTDAGSCRLSVKDAIGNEVHDTDPSLYQDAQAGLRQGNVLDGSNLSFVVGKRTYEKALDGRSYSRALENAASYAFTLSGCGNTVEGTFTTAPIPFGSTRGEALPVAAPGTYAYPTINWSNQNERIIDAQSGVAYRRITGPGGGTPTNNVKFLTAWGNDWVNPASVVSDDANAATISGSQASLYVAWDQVSKALGTTAFDGTAFDYFSLTLKGKATAGSQTDRDIEVCLSIDQGNSCYSPWNTVHLTTSDATYTIGTTTPIDTLGALIPMSKQQAAARYGNVTYNAATRTVTLTSQSSIAHPGRKDAFDTNWAVGTTIRIASGTVRIDDITAGSLPIVTTSGPHGFSSGQTVLVSLPTSDGLSGATGTWPITVTGANTFVLNGATTTGTYGTYYNNCVSKTDTTAGSPPVLQVINSNWSDPAGVRVALGGFTDAGWTSLNNKIYTVSARNGDTEHWIVNGASTTGTYTQNGCPAYARKLSGTVQAIGDYSIASVDSATQMTLRSGPAADITANASGAGADYEYHPFGVLIRKKTNSSDTISVQYLSANYAISGGMGWPAMGGPFTHRVPVNGYFFGVLWPSALWAFASDGTAAKFIGNVQQGLNGSFASGDGCFGGGMSDPNDPNQWYCDTNTLGGRTVGRGILLNDGTPVVDTGQSPTAPMIPMCSAVSNRKPCWVSWVQLFPSPGGYVSLITAADPGILTLWPTFGTSSCWPGGFGWNTTTNTMHFSVVCGGGQNNGRKFYVFDLGNEIPYGQPGSTIHLIGFRDTWSGKDARWSGSHGGGGVRGFPEKGYITWASHWLNAGFNPSTQDNAGPYHLTVDTPFTSTSAGSCAAWVGNPYLLNPLPADMKCETKHVSGEPCDDSMAPQEQLVYNANTALHNSKCGRSNSYYMQDAILGDVFTFGPAATNADHEIMTLIDKGADGKTWTFSRGHLWGYWTDNAYFPGIYDHNPGTKIYAFTNIHNFNYKNKSGYAAWDYMADPTPGPTHDAIVRVANMTDGHGWDGWLGESHVGVDSPICGAYCEGVRVGPIEERWPKTTFDAIATLSPPFAGITTLGFPNNVDSHPTYAQSAEGADTSWWLDGRPLLNAASPAATSVTGQRYRYANSSLKIKYFEVMAYAANYPIMDVSGPGSVLGTGPEDSYKGCFAFIDGECDAASKAGDYYVNAPGITNSASQYVCCGADPSGNRDIGWLNAWPAAHQMTQTLLRDDATGKYTRNLGRGLLQYRLFDTFYNLLETSDGKTGLIRVLGLGGIRSDVVSFKMPPVVLDSVNRGTFVPVTVEGTRTAGVRTRVKFGYDLTYSCTSRREPCYAVSGTLNETTPFLFAMELTANSGDASAEYRIAIPGVSGKIVYYQVEYVDSSGSPVAAGPAMVTAVQ